jgi:hypothetical protein
MNMPANHAVHPALATELNHRVFVIGYVFHRRLGFEFDVGSERPVTKTQRAPQPIEPHIHIENAVVQRRADAIEQTVEVREAVELMPVQHEITFAINGRVHDAFRQVHGAERHADPFFEELIVIAGEKGHLGFLAVFAKQFLDEQIVILGPIPFAAQLPSVNEIAHDVEMGAVVVAQERQQLVHLRVLCAEMHIGYPDGTIVHGA